MLSCGKERLPYMRETLSSGTPLRIRNLSSRNVTLRYVYVTWFTLGLRPGRS